MMDFGYLPTNRILFQLLKEVENPDALQVTHQTGREPVAWATTVWYVAVHADTILVVDSQIAGAAAQVSGA